MGGHRCIIRCSILHKGCKLFFFLNYINLSKINWENRFKNWDYKNPSCVVDTTHTPVLAEKAVSPQQFWFFKHKCYALKYQIVCSLRDSLILLPSHGYPGSIHDFRIANISGLDSKLEQQGEVCIGDKAYKGSYQFITPHKVSQNQPLNEQQKQENKLLEKKRHIVENMNKRLKDWKVIDDVWRHKIEKHPKIFNVVAMITNLDLYLHPLKKNL